MSSAPGISTRFLRELAKDGRTQTAALVLAGLAAWVAWPSQHPVRRIPGSGSPSSPASADVARFAALPGLQRLQRAGELPDEPSMKRDLFLFDEPGAAVPETRPTVGAEPLPATVDANEVERRQVLATAPATLRYLGFLRGRPAGLIGAFMRGEEPETLLPGTVLAGWRLMQVGESAAIFQSVRFPDLRFTLQAKGES